MSTKTEQPTNEQVNLEKLVRQPLAVGNEYRFANFPTAGIRIKALCFPNTPSDDGGLPGVAIAFFGNQKISRWHICKNEEEFWANFQFQHLYDPECFELKVA